LDNLVLGRNELAKWHKLNSTLIDLPRHVFSDKFKKNGDEIGGGAPPDVPVPVDAADDAAKWDTIKVVKLPAMISRVQECKGCFSKEVCTLAAISIEADIPRKDPVGKFPAFQEINQRATKEIKSYFKKFIECINLEQSAEMDRQSSSYNTTINKETEMKIVQINPNGVGGTSVTLQKPIHDSKTSELAERTFVNLYTKNNISFGKGFIVLR